MKANALLGRLKTEGKNVEWLITEMESDGVKISYSAIYRKLRGESQFTAPEIKSISIVMGLSREDMYDIFFEELVS